jgi:biotin carboxyl carrier protein
VCAELMAMAVAPRLFVQTSPERHTSPSIATVVDVLVPDGAQVRAGTGILVLEARRAERVVTARKFGTIRLHVKRGDHVEVGAPLFDVK